MNRLDDRCDLRLFRFGCREIAKVFHLGEWESRTDIHYMMGDSIDDFFDD